MEKFIEEVEKYPGMSLLDVIELHNQIGIRGTWNIQQKRPTFEVLKNLWTSMDVDKVYGYQITTPIYSDKYSTSCQSDDSEWNVVSSLNVRIFIVDAWMICLRVRLTGKKRTNRKFFSKPAKRSFVLEQFAKLWVLGLKMKKLSWVKMIY